MIDGDRLAPMFRAARMFGWLVAHGMMDHREALNVLDDAAIGAGARGDRAGMRSRLSWALLDHAAISALAATRAGWAVRQAVEPLLRPGIPSARIFAAAEDAAGGELPRHEARALARGMMAAALRRARAQARQASVRRRHG